MNSVPDCFNQKMYNITPQYYVPTKHVYKADQMYGDAHGTIICNAARKGKLEVSEQNDFDVAAGSSR